jgi:hypothetical protein
MLNFLLQNDNFFFSIFLPFFPRKNFQFVGYENLMMTKLFTDRLRPFEIGSMLITFEITWAYIWVLFIISTYSWRIEIRKNRLSRNMIYLLLLSFLERNVLNFVYTIQSYDTADRRHRYEASGSILIHLLFYPIIVRTECLEFCLYNTELWYSR